MEQAEMKIKSIAPWFGGKRMLAGEIGRELGPHSMYVEPFCGSMAVLLMKPKSGSDIVNDLHGNIINLALVIASKRCYELYDRLYRTMDCETFFDGAKEMFMAQGVFEPPAGPGAVTEEHVERAYIYFVVSWMGRNGISGTKRCNYQKARRWTPGGGSGAVRFASAVDSIPAWHERLRRVNIYCMDGFELLEKIEDHRQTAIYLDPPYLRHTVDKSRAGNGVYQHEFEPGDHEKLAARLKRFERARVVVSYYDDPQLDELYPGWTKRKMEIQKTLHLQNKRNVKRVMAPEVLLLNGPSYANEEKGLF